jgi:hypothetical protein
VNKIYAAIAISVVLVFGWYRYDSLVSERDQLAANLKVTEDNLADKTAVLEKERSDALDASARAKQNQLKTEEVTDEVSKLRACIDAGTCGVRWKYQACPRMPSGDTATGGQSAIAEDAAARRNFESWYFDFLEQIRQTEVLVKALQEDVKIRSNPDYCKPPK